ncbi:MAG: uracil-DNA glycosylase [Planctomycetes bacterium]|nr:uracil-DNA glycosylase [Planctomycetota bacterium]
MSAAGEERRAPDCFRCRAFFVTYEPARPYGCRTFAFSSAHLPCDTVRLSSGQECSAFEAKPEGARHPKSKPRS